MAKEEITLQNFAGGELSYNMYGRYELPIYRNGCRHVDNFIIETQGPARFRNGFVYVNPTRGNRTGVLAKFEFNDEQAYQLEFTHLKLRFYKDEGVILETAKNITGATQASPGVITANSHGYASGDQVYISSVGGMTELNGKMFLVVYIGANTFSLTDLDGNAINTTAYTAYTSGGTVARVYEITTPYDEDLDLTQLKYDQNADTMYIVHPYYEPRKLTRTGHTAWTLSRYTRTNDPFLDKKTITGITQANPGVVTSVGHGFANDEIVIIEEVVGMTQVNSIPFMVKNVAANTFDLYDLDGNAVNTSSYTSWSSAGFASKQELLPAAFTFYESRAWFGGAEGTPDKFHGSRAPDSTGDPRYDDFTSGTNDDDAVEFTIADAEVNKILWLKGTDRLLFAGTFGAEVKITGETDDKPITPTSVNARAVNRLGVANIAPVNKENSVIYVQRGKRTLRSFEFEALTDAFVSVDRNLVSEDITYGNLKQLAWQSGRPDILWIVKEDGELLGVTYKSREDVSGWHRHYTYGGEDLFLSVSTMPRPSGFDQLWAIVEREVDGHTRRYVEYMEDPAVIPNRLHFFTDEESEDDDTETFYRAMSEAQKWCLHLDSALSYDGSLTGTNAGATLTPAAVTGNSVVFTASASVFKSTDVGRELWKKAIDGEGYGRARILTYTSGTQVTCAIEEDFDSVTAMAAGNWYITTDSVGNLSHLEGREVGVVADGGVHPNVTVTDGEVELDYQASVVHVGLRYTGFLQPMSIEAGGATGPSQTKSGNVYEVGIRFLNTLGCQFGTNLYKAEELPFENSPLRVGSPEFLFTGVKKIPYHDSWEDDKVVFIRQINPLPCIVQLLALYVERDNG